MRASISPFVKGLGGNAATEFAFILPVMLLFIGGIVELGRAFVAYNAVNRLATRYAITYADCFDNPSGTCGNSTGELVLFSSQTAIQNMAPQLNPAPAPRMFEVLMSTGLPSSATIVYSTVSGGLTAPELAQAQTAIGPGQYGVVVTVSYVFKPSFFSSMAQYLPQRTITYTVAQRKN